MSNAIIAAIVSCCVSFFLGGALAYALSRVKGILNREKATQDGLMCLLRNEIIEAHDKYTDRGYCPIYKKEAIRKSYESYHNLGGNGLVTKLYEDIMKLPEEPPKRRKEGGETKLSEKSPKRHKQGGKN